MLPHSSPRSPIEGLVAWIVGVMVFVIALQILMALFVQWMTAAAPYVLIALLFSLPIYVWWRRRFYY